MFFVFVVLTMAAIVSAVLILTGTLSLRDSEGRDGARCPQGRLDGNSQGKDSRPHPRERSASASQRRMLRVPAPGGGQPDQGRVETADDASARECGGSEG